MLQRKLWLKAQEALALIEDKAKEEGAASQILHPPP